MKESQFRELCGDGCETLEIAGKSVPALVSTVADEKTILIGGTLNRANYVARVCAIDIAPVFPSELPGKVISYNGNAFRIVQVKKHPRSDIIHLTMSEK